MVMNLPPPGIPGSNPTSNECVSLEDEAQELFYFILFLSSQMILMSGEVWNSLEERISQVPSSSKT